MHYAVLLIVFLKFSLRHVIPMRLKFKQQSTSLISFLFIDDKRHAGKTLMFRKGA